MCGGGIVFLKNWEEKFYFLIAFNFESGLSPALAAYKSTGGKDCLYCR
jgi:hypothetical protein